MEIIKELPSNKSLFEYTEPNSHYSANETKDTSWQSLLQVMEPPQMATSLPSGAFSRRSTLVSLTPDTTDRGHHSPLERKRSLASSHYDAPSSYYSSAPKLSKKGWMLSTSEVSNGQHGCYLSASYTSSSELTDEHLLHSSSSVQSFCDDLVQAQPKPTLSPSTSTLALSDGSPSSDIVGPSSIVDDLGFMFDERETLDCTLGYMDGWLPEFPLGYPGIPPQHIAYASHSGNSSDVSTDESVVQHRKEELVSMKVQKEHAVLSHGKLDSVMQMQTMPDAGKWERQKEPDGLEEMFTPVKRVRKDEGNFNGAISMLGSSSQVDYYGAPPPYSGPAEAENTWQKTLPAQGGFKADAGALSLESSTKHPSNKQGRLHSGGEFANFSNEKSMNNNKLACIDKCHDNIASQTPGPISFNNNGIHIQQDTTREFGLNTILGSSLGVVRSESDYSEICLVHLLITGAEAVATRDMDLASVILVRLKELVSCSGSTMQRVAAYFSDGLQSRIEGNHVLDRIGYNKSQSDILAAFQILHEISPYIKFGHFTANQAILEAVEEEKSVHIVDFEIMEGIQWPPLMKALVSRKGGPPSQLRITALSRPHAEHGLASVQETGKRLSDFALSLNLPFSFNTVRVNNEEEFSVSSVKLVKGEALVVNCMLHLPHMPHRMASSVSSFLHGMRRLSPTLLTLVEEELGCSTMAVASYFFEALQHYSAICDSLEACLSTESVARVLVERVFLAPRINSTVRFWSGSSAQSELGAEFATSYNWCSLVRSVGFKSVPLSFLNLSQARLLLGLYKDGFKLDERSNRLVLGWRAKHLFAASVWN